MSKYLFRSESNFVQCLRKSHTLDITGWEEEEMEDEEDEDEEDEDEKEEKDEEEEEEEE